jgi:hypothetical protein
MLGAAGSATAGSGAATVTAGAGSRPTRAMRALKSGDLGYVAPLIPLAAAQTLWVDGLAVMRDRNADSDIVIAAAQTVCLALDAQGTYSLDMDGPPVTVWRHGARRGVPTTYRQSSQTDSPRPPVHLPRKSTRSIRAFVRT